MTATPQELLDAVLSAKILKSGANLTIPENPRSGTTSRGVLHGWVQIEFNGKVLKFSENRNPTTIKRRLLGAVDPNANLNALRSKTLREAYDGFIEKVKDAADNAADARERAEGAQIDAKVQQVLAARREREKKAAYQEGLQKLETLFAGPLYNMDEEELLEVFRTNRVRHVMES